MVGATRRFDIEQRALLNVALDALEDGPYPRSGPMARALDLAAIDDDHPLSVIRPVITAIDKLSGDVGSVEAQGAGSELCLPAGTLRRFVAG